MNLDLDGDSALVTASSAGLGKASARALSREGADVVVNGRDPDRLAAATEEIRADAAGEVVPVRGDLTDPDDPEALVEAAVEAFGGLDHLVTSAGGPPSGLVGDLPEREWYRTYDLLVMSVVRLVREAIPHLREGGGSVVTIASRAVKEASESVALTNSVRMGVTGLEKTLSRELAPEVRANAVLPGSIETERVHDLLSDAVERGEFDSFEAARAARVAGVPLDRLGDPMALGNTVAFLCSPRGSYLNGVAIPITGGEHRSNV